jgi:hypothetical protein
VTVDVGATIGHCVLVAVLEGGPAETRHQAPLFLTDSGVDGCALHAGAKRRLSGGRAQRQRAARRQRPQLFDSSPPTPRVCVPGSARQDR